ncbi:hypothetical protein JXA12_06085 [Candidatus Woesearchaeota archaeon]|nr:hypothetical protein [Candidatus Woesearchaeota archaeon]
MNTEESLREFMGPFGVAVPEGVVCRGRRAYLVPESVRVVASKVKLEPFSIGLPLGESTVRGFKPSFALLDLMRKSRNRVIVSDDAEWLFTCGRDVFPEKVLYEGELKEVFLVTNKQGEVLGLGRKEMRGKKALVKNLYDRGDFLRREEKRKRR